MPRAVVIKVRRQNGSIAKFKIRANSKFKKMMKTYCSLHVSINYQKVFAIVTIKISVTEF